MWQSWVPNSDLLDKVKNVTPSVQGEQGACYGNEGDITLSPTCLLKCDVGKQTTMFSQCPQLTTLGFLLASLTVGRQFCTRMDSQ